jgi:hypothetical protein
MLNIIRQFKRRLSRSLHLAYGLIGAWQVFVSSIQADVIIDASLQAYWNAENGAVDATANGHDGIFQGNADVVPGGLFGNSFTFDGTGDYINIGDELDMGASNFTLSAWVKGDPSMNEWARIFDKGFFSAYELGRTSFAPTIGFTYLNSDSFFTSSSSLINNTWNHVAVVKSGTTATVYANGTAENSVAVSSASQDNALPLYIGYNPGEGTRGYWKGQLDELAIYNRALAPQEIGTLASRPGGPSGLIAYWDAENGATDVTGNGHDGDFQGNATTTTSGPFGKAFTFDGNGDYINIGDELDMNASDFTLSAWVKGDPSMNEWGRIFDKGFFSAYELGRTGFSSTIGFTYLNSNSAFSSTSSLIDNTWHHVALVKSGTTATVYANGAAENSVAVRSASQDNALPLFIGYNPGEGTRGYWKGMLDELKVFNRALNASEIAALATDFGGDFNYDGAVNAADYVAWRKTDDSSDGYNEWRRNFGRTYLTGSGPAFKGVSDSSTDPSRPAVPEPRSVVLLLVGLSSGPWRRGRADAIRDSIQIRKR